MDSKTISSIAEFETTFGSRRAYGTVFRGVPNSLSPYNLVPGVGRLQHLRGAPRAARQQYEGFILDEFKRQATAFLRHSPRDSFEWVATAQHHGLPTRLLDWTKNPLVAAFFAVSDLPETDGAIYELTLDQFITSFSDDTPEAVGDVHSPFTVTTLVMFQPAHTDLRMSAQAGVFTIQADPFVPVAHGSLIKITLAASIKAVLLSRLENYGIHRASLFPGLDGVADRLRDLAKADGLIW